MTDYLADFLALREANERLRQQGIDELWGLLNHISARLNVSNGQSNGEFGGETIGAGPGGQRLELGRQEWEFTVRDSTMVGERLGLRCNVKTLVFELGWPRVPAHGYVPGTGLARGRIGFSQNVMLDPRPLADLILRRVENPASPRWYFIDHEQIRGEELTEHTLSPFILQILDPS